MGPVYLRLSVTDRCNLRCSYCMPRGTRAPRGGRLDGRQLLELVSHIHRVAPVGKVRITGGEPLLFSRLPELVRDLRRLLPGATLGLTTNGTHLEALASPLREAGLDALNVSLDSSHPEVLARLTGGGDLDAVERGLGAARAAGFRGVKLNTVLLRGGNGRELLDLVKLARRHGCEIRFIELMPLGPGAAIYPREHLSAAEALQRLGQSLELVEPLGRQGAARRYRMRAGDGGEVVIGLISPVSRPFCGGCDRARLDARGHLFGCLRQQHGEDLGGPLLRGHGPELERRVRAVLDAKQSPGRSWPRRSMATIGG